MHIRHIQTLFSPEHGGPLHSLTNYCVHQVALGHEVSLRVLEGFPGTSPAVRPSWSVDQRVFSVSPPSKIGYSREFRASLAKDTRPDLFHIHGSWHIALADAARSAGKGGIPYLFEPMGSYSRYEFGRKPLRKALFRSLFQDRILQRAACLHVNSRPEGLFLRSLGIRSPIAVLPVGVDIGRFAENLGAKPADWPVENGLPFVLFLSRIHPTKGIDLLLKAWSGLKGRFPSWNLIVAGTGDEGHVRMYRKLAREEGLGSTCFFVGSLSEAAKVWAMHNASIYVLPSRQENFGNVVAEALACGTPVLTTTSTPWLSSVDGKCGWVCPADISSISSALAEAMAAPESRRATFGAAGRALASANFSIDRVIGDLDRVCKWAAGGQCPSDLLI
jgi:glycosyltransferase involved in cell wall biosynthesis